MNAKVHEFIEKMKKEKKEEELKERKRHLILLGLVDDNKKDKGIVYLDAWDGTKECKWDNNAQKYYKEGIYNPIEITDEEYQEILKYAPIPKEEALKPEPETPSANTIKLIANILLFLNLIGGLILSIILENWIPIVSAIIYGILLYPLIIGFSKIVKAAEKQL